ncbi:MAG: ATP-binding protein [Oligoflexia bacterium]|nr:ATP-binding protein [Oligoflexia bacterium]
MALRSGWQAAIHAHFEKKSVVWLKGVRRSGKTTLCRQLPDFQYFDCELPRVRRMLEDPEAFFSDLRATGIQKIVLDEIHRLPEPSEALKIAADHFSGVQVLATGSSSLGAIGKFKDTLTDRKRDLWLTPMDSRDLRDFGPASLKMRLQRGGLPPAFLSGDAAFYQDWLDSFWSKDILELFRVEKRVSFMRFIELLFTQSGGVFEATRFARLCEVSRPTILNYLGILQATFAVQVIRPFHSGNPTEIVAAPRVYAFDTGFVVHFNGWDPLRPDDFGLLWEQYVLNELCSALQGTASIHYWRDKQGHEVDFVVPLSRGKVIAIECKWQEKKFDPIGIRQFRKLHPDGPNYLVAQDVDRAQTRRLNGIEVTLLPLEKLRDLVISRK